MTTIQVVPMTRTHIDLLMPYEREMFGTEAWSRLSYYAELADRRHRTYVVALGADETFLGWAGVRVIGDEAEILTVGVVPHARRSGIGRRLLAALVNVARERSAVAVFLEVRTDNAPALTLYEAEGFARIGVRRGYYDRGRVDAVTMRLDLRLCLHPELRPDLRPDASPDPRS